MSLTTTAKNQAADAITIDTISLHTGDPTAAGTANEIPPGVYARKAIAFGAAANGVRTQTADVLLDVPAGTTVRWYVLWAGSAPKKFAAFSAEEAYTGQGQHKVTAGTLTVTG